MKGKYSLKWVQKEETFRGSALVLPNAPNHQRSARTESLLRAVRTGTLRASLLFRLIHYVYLPSVEISTISMKLLTMPVHAPDASLDRYMMPSSITAPLRIWLSRQCCTLHADRYKKLCPLNIGLPSRSACQARPQGQHHHR